MTDFHRRWRVFHRFSTKISTGWAGFSTGWAGEPTRLEALRALLAAPARGTEPIIRPLVVNRELPPQRPARDGAAIAEREARAGVGRPGLVLVRRAGERG